jgi:hypothetical protein
MEHTKHVQKSVRVNIEIIQKTPRDLLKTSVNVMKVLKWVLYK